MNLRPWNLWKPDGSMQPETPEILATLERVLRANPDHPGALHLYIHAVEAGPDRGGAKRRPIGSRRSCRAPATSSTCPRTSTGASVATRTPST